MITTNSNKPGKPIKNIYTFPAEKLIEDNLELINQ